MEQIVRYRVSRNIFLLLLVSLYTGPALAHWRPCSKWCIAKKYRWVIYARNEAPKRLAASAEDARIEDRGAEGAEGVEFLGRGVPLPSRLTGLGSVVSSPSGVRGGAPAANTF